MTQNRFDALAATWDDSPHRRALIQALAGAVRVLAAPAADARVLEYGCGTAALGLLLAGEVKAVTAVDASAGMIAEARRKVEAHRLTNVRVRVLDLVAEDPPHDECYELIVSAMVLHHVTDVPRLLRRLVALLAPGGRLFLADLMEEDGSFHGDVAVPHHGFNPDALMRELAEAGLCDGHWQVIHEVEKPAGRYPIFALVARRPD